MKYVLYWGADMSGWWLPGCANNRTRLHIRYTLFRFTCYHGTQPFGDQALSFDFNAEVSSIESKEKNAVNEQCHVNLYSEETNVVLVPYLYRIVPHIHSALFSTLYMGKRSAIELLLKARALFLECVENMYPKVLIFSKQTYGLILVG